MEIHKTGFIHNPDPMSTPFRVDLHPALQEVIDAYEERHKSLERQRGEGDSLCLRSVRVAIDGLCMFYNGKLSDLDALNRQEDLDKILSNAYFIILKQLRSLQKMAAGKREVLCK